MSLHSEKAQADIGKTLAQKVIEFSNHCKNDEYKDEKTRCYELSLIADFARQVNGCDEGQE